jgi:hypothetical protein
MVLVSPRALFATVKRSSFARPWNLGAAAEKSERFFSLFATVNNLSEAARYGQLLYLSNTALFDIYLLHKQDVLGKSFFKANSL